MNICFRPRPTPLLLLLAALTLAGCRQDMHDGLSYEALEDGAFAPGRGWSRQPVEGTVARGELRADPHLWEGKQGAEFVDTFPFVIARGGLDRGRERYDIFCSPCHGRGGDGDGMVVRRGFRRPASFHSETLRQQPVGYLFDVMTRGFGAMPSYEASIAAADRWRIAAYLRALQLSRMARRADVPPEELARLEEGGE
jgi:mono/diheme cytochrome c family protein